MWTKNTVFYLVGFSVVELQKNATYIVKRFFEKYSYVRVLLID